MTGKTDAPVVSVVVPTHNRADLLGVTLASILAQTYRDFELIVVSDGSTDHTPEVVKSLADARTRLIEQPNSGSPASPRNTGIRNARGRYIAFCDDDDLWAPEKLALQVEAMESVPDLGLTYTDRDVLYGTERRYFPGEIRQAGFYGLMFKNRITASSVLVRRAALDRAGLFDEGREVATVEDYELWLRLAFLHPIRLVGNSPLVSIRIHGANLGAPVKRMRLVLRILRRWIGRPGVSRPTVALAMGQCAAKLTGFLILGRTAPRIKRAYYGIRRSAAPDIASARNHNSSMDKP